MAQVQSPPALDHYYRFGDVYEALEACDQLEMLLGRLQRQHLLREEECAASREDLTRIRGRVEAHLNSASLMPKGPRL